MRKPLEKIVLRPRKKLGDNNMVLREIRYEDGRCLELAQDCLMATFSTSGDEFSFPATTVLP